ncbi:hypothetical protein [Crassaminicella indica]|uniref:Uncharacterized protein n=1 Tax=Crassaminicella indica TaxID=2855394 RepID=A0ABX8R8K6_9CLOT|nr:hypothetical protein [Crassaminicella indica]QXM05131.1 hypothetical protein KVH43_06895 [Crassaminicella indica]
MKYYTIKDKYKNINKSPKMKKIIKSLQRQVSRKYEIIGKSYEKIMAVR